MNWIIKRNRKKRAVPVYPGPSHQRAWGSHPATHRLEQACAVILHALVSVGGAQASNCTISSKVVTACGIAVLYWYKVWCSTRRAFTQSMISYVRIVNIRAPVLV